MAKGPESKLQMKIKKALEGAFPGSFWFKTHGGPYQRQGIPDLIGCVNGKFIGIEVKVPGKLNQVTDLQQYTINLIQKAGGISFVSDSIEHSINKVKSLLNKK